MKLLTLNPTKFSVSTYSNGQSGGSTKTNMYNDDYLWFAYTTSAFTTSYYDKEYRFMQVTIKFSNEADVSNVIIQSGNNTLYNGPQTYLYKLKNEGNVGNYLTITINAKSGKNVSVRSIRVLALPANGIGVLSLKGNIYTINSSDELIFLCPEESLAVINIQYSWMSTADLHKVVKMGDTTDTVINLIQNISKEFKFITLEGM